MTELTGRVHRTPGIGIAFFYWTLLLAASGCTLLVFCLRFWSVLRFHGLIPTGGVEGSGSFGVFEVCAGQPVYHDFTQSPNIAVFNFVFYEFYGLAVRLFGSCSVATPLFGRLLTVALLACLSIVIFIARDRRLHPIEAATIAIGAFSPYVGWWAFGLRPDIGAAVFLALCLVMMIFYLRNPTALAAMAVGFFLVCAWGFKQPFAFAGPVLLWFILRKNFRHALAFAIVAVVGVITPFIIFGVKPYYLSTVYVLAGEPLIARTALSNFMSFIAKASPILVLTAVTVSGCREKRPCVGQDFLILLLIFSLVVFVVASANFGAADNYYLPSFVIASVFSIKYLQRCGLWVRRFAMAAYSVLSVASALVILTGFYGNIALPLSDLRTSEKAAAEINRMAPPKLVWGEIIALPWFTKNVETRILWYREAAQTAKGGIDPRKNVAAGHYQTVVLPTHAQRSFDLSRYRLTDRIENIQIYARRR